MDHDDEQLEEAVTAANLLDTIAHLCARSCQLAATTGDRAEWIGHADYTAYCIAQVAQVRPLARDFMETAARIARRRIGADVELTAEQFVRALMLTDDYAAHVLARVPVTAP